ncbi:RagB/SusD family nutrient uptake outer membrane protein [Hymenobacter sp. BT18]|uniref:RagB/SusD family nutrient uptake outer membrane protein n=1 Tax=Hymenobacter sp. BT18 TaxID=2835648 RepID=UPI00143E1D85|nr:RagB/SusD family nutrient uptake outer membrane protein [Hymenobacter sp. BT18]QIX60719.1 RagB/SusD family nutrient uptake outer membrane protein [Hymenobacter sp. BT18]
MVGTFGREVTVLAATESRWYGELQGTRATLDDAAYYNAYYVPLAQTRRAAQVYRESANNSQALTDVQKQGVAGYTHTYEALAKLLMLNLQGDNGIRIDLDNPLKPGKFVAPAEALTNIRGLLDLGASELDKGGDAFGFSLSAGYAGFNTPATFKKFNRALAARVALYQGDYAGAKEALAASFYDPAALLTLGPKITFNPAIAGDQGNPYFQVPNGNGSNVVVVPDNFVSEAEAGDARLAKVGLRTTPRVTGGLTGNYEARVFATNTSPLDIIRNEELILISAEAKANTNDLAGALADINVIRTKAGGLAALPEGTFSSVEKAMDEILKQRRYSLFYEGHYFIDLRRTGRLKPVVSPGQTLAYSSSPYALFTKMEKPAAEKAWDRINP